MNAVRGTRCYCFSIILRVVCFANISCWNYEFFGWRSSCIMITCFVYVSNGNIFPFSIVVSLASIVALIGICFGFTFTYWFEFHLLSLCFDYNVILSRWWYFTGEITNLSNTLWIFKIFNCIRPQNWFHILSL